MAFPTGEVVRSSLSAGRSKQVLRETLLQCGPYPEGGLSRICALITADLERVPRGSENPTGAGLLDRDSSEP